MEIIHISYSRVYRYKGVTFEWHNYLGPTVINRHTGEERPHKNISLRVWSQIAKFAHLSDEEQAQYEIDF